jgi:hypothetical protein
MDPADRAPRRGRPRARPRFGGDERQCALALRAADQAARDDEQARIALSTSLSVLERAPGSGSALASLLDLLDRAGRSQEASPLGTAVWRGSRPTATRTQRWQFARILDRLGTGPLAGDVSKWDPSRRAVRSRRRASPNLCEVLYRAPSAGSTLGRPAARLGRSGTRSSS